MMTRKKNGFSLIELMVAVAIISLLATLTVPMAQLSMQRTKERELKDALKQIRNALDAYKQAVSEKRIVVEAGSTGYPPNLQRLVEGVADAKSPKKDQKIYFLRRLPRDPMNGDTTLSADATWGKRSYASPPDAPQEGDDVFDVYSLSDRVGLNGTPYRSW